MIKSTITVLHVDDDEAFTELVREYIQYTHDDISVHTAHRGEDALAHLETTDDVDCVVSDYEMPGKNGLELLGAVRDRYPTLPFILFTGKGSEEIAESAINAGVTDYLQKRPGTSQYAMLVNRVRNAVAYQRAKTELRRASERTASQFELLVETVEHYVIFLLDKHGCVQTWNRGAENIEGYTSDEIIGEHFSTFYREADVESGVPEQNLGEATTHGITNKEGWRVRKDGSRFWADVTISTLDQGGELVSYINITRDSTQHRRKQMLLEENQQLKDHITALSHDLQSPLSAARGNLELAMDTDDLSRLDAVMRGLNRMQELLDYLTMLANEGRQIMDPKPINFHEVVEAAWSIIDTDVAELVMEENTIFVADRPRLQQLLENLFKNAVEHASSDVIIRTGRLPGGGVYIEDNGPGIPAAKRDRVFEMGYSTAPNGTGIGLAICKQIADAHGWFIEVSEGSDGGARFELSGVEGA